MLKLLLSPGQVTSTPTRPVENVVITTKGLQERNNLLLDGRTVENKGKLILSTYDHSFLYFNRNFIFKRKIMSHFFH